MSNYGINQNTSEGNVANVIQPGIKDNIALTSVVFEPLKPGGDNLIQVNFVDEYGGELREILWPVDEERERENAEKYPREHKRDNEEHGFVKGQQVTGEDRIIQAYELFNQRAKHIATKFIPEEEIVTALAEAGSYEEFGEIYSNLFKEKYIKGVRVRLKVTLNNSNYSQLPNFPPFIESMDIPREDSRLEIGPYDRVTKGNTNGASDPENWEEEGVDLEDEPAF